ncbi:MAG: 50S ribosomal protein L16 [Candidatus Micrarchaeia archaeon]
MGLRPARTCRDLDKVAWTRFSQKVPRRSYVKTRPHSTLTIFKMGEPKKEFNYRVDLVSEEDVQVRDNALESARLAINKFLEKKLPLNYWFVIRVYPHNIVRENKMILGAGADRLQKGMRKAFGRATDRAARIKGGQVIFNVFVAEKNVSIVKEAYKRACVKMPGRYSVRITKVAS